MSPELVRALNDLRAACAAEDAPAIRATSERVAALWDQHCSPAPFPANAPRPSTNPEHIRHTQREFSR